MTKFILHGGFTRRENELNRTFFEEVVRDIPEGATLLMVFFAARYDDPTETFNELKQKLEAAAGSKKLNITLATKENFIQELTDAKAVYFHGGSTNKLLDVLRSYGSIKPLIEGKTVAGSSAGAYAIAAYGASHSEDAMLEGLGLAPLRVVCHYESAELPPAAGAVEVLKNTATDLELVLLHDFEWKVFNY